MGRMKDISSALSTPSRFLGGVTVLLAGVLSFLLLGWLCMVWRADAANHDVFWLFTGFERLNAGETMYQSFYETNPPLSVFIYAPAFWVADHAWLSLPRAVFLYTGMLLALAVAATFHAARYITLLSRHQLWLLCGGLVVCGTVMTTPNYGQRDHFLALAAVPVALLLLGRTWAARRLNLMDVAILFIGTLFLLLKPYYGLLPAFLMLHRAATQRRVAALWDGDFVVMAAAAMAYAAWIYFFFNDYLSLILPAVIDLYADSGWSVMPMRVALTVSVWLMFMGLSFNRALPEAIRRLTRMLLLFSALAFVVFALMMKGYAYHLLPCLTFLYLAGLLLGDGLLAARMKTPRRRGLLLLAALAAICLILPDSFIPDKETVTRQPITKAVAACGADCSFLIMGSTVRITQLVSYYTHKPHASRFPKFWFAEGMMQDGVDIEKGSAGLGRYRHYVDMITADINRYKPRVIFSCNYYADIMPWLSADEGFKDAFSHYRKAAFVSYDHAAFHHGGAAVRPLIVKCTQYNRI